MCTRHIMGNSFLHLPVIFPSNRWSGFQDFMFTVLENVVSAKARLNLDMQFCRCPLSSAGSYIYHCNSLNFWNFGARLLLKYVENM